MMRGAHRYGHGPDKVTLEKPILSTYGRLWQHTWSQRRPLVVAFAAVGVSTALGLVTPQITRYTIDTVIPRAQANRIPLVMAAVLGTTALLGLCTFVRSYFMSLAGQRVVFDIRNRLYRHMQRLSLSFFHNRRTGDLMSRVTNDVGSLQQIITSGVMDIISDIATFGVVLSILFWTDWRMTLLVLPTFPLMIWATRRFGGRIRTAYRDVQANMARVNEHLQETISGIEVVKTFANEDHEYTRFSERNRDSMQSNLTAVRIWAQFHPIIDLLNSLGNVIVLGFGARQIMNGHLTVGALVAFMAYLRMLNRPIRQFSRILNVIQQAAASAERIFEILDTVPEVQEKPDAVALPASPAAIALDRVSFSYDKVTPILRDITFEVEPGTTVALVGPSGAGKSTLVSLLMRFYDPDSGSIGIGGHDLRDATLDSLRAQYGVVSQEIILLSGTVRENIAYGKPTATGAEIRQAAHFANAHGFISEFPEGYETQIGERGVKLSGGQRQRIAIARAILRDPRILVFDEATSHLDTESEHEIQEAMERLKVGRTTIMIAHRLATVQKADRILVLREGEVVESGSPQELLALGGTYADWCERQQLAMA